LNLPARNQKKEITKQKNTNHHSPEELGEDQPPPILPGEQKTLQLKRLRDRQKNSRENGGYLPPPAKTDLTEKKLFFFL
jgi:hypothetical protein